MSKRTIFITGGASGIGFGIAESMIRQGHHVIIADINDAAIAGITASKDSTNNLVITITQQPSNVWQYIIGAGSANTAIGITAGTYVPTMPTSINYHDTWRGTRTNRGENQQMNSIIRYFENMGYKIERSANVTSQNTFQWNVYW